MHSVSCGKVGKGFLWCIGTITDNSYRNIHAWEKKNQPQIPACCVEKLLAAQEPYSALTENIRLQESFPIM